MRRLAVGFVVATLAGCATLEEEMPMRAPQSPSVASLPLRAGFVAVDDPERARVAVPDVALGLGERVFEDVDLDAVVGERARLVEPEGFEVPRDDLHGGDPAALHRRDEPSL